MRKNVVLTYFWFVLFTGYASAQVFEESGGVIKIQMEFIQLVEKWRLATAVDGYTGSGYIYWHASTSDHDPHDVFVVFDEPGLYTIQMAARSSWHLLDKKVFYHIGMTDLESVTGDQAPFARIIEE